MDFIHCFIHEETLESKMSRRMSAAAFHTETSPKTNSPAAQSLGMKNETEIIVITGLRNSIVEKTGKNEKF